MSASRGQQPEGGPDPPGTRDCWKIREQGVGWGAGNQIQDIGSERRPELRH